MKEDPVKPLLDAEITTLGMLLFIFSLVLPARYLVWRTWFGFQCWLVAVLGILDGKTWQHAFQFHTSPHTEIFWGGVVNILFLATWIFSKRLFHPSQVACCAVIYAVTLIFVLYCIREDLLFGFYVWIVAHAVMICGLIISTFSAARPSSADEEKSTPG